MTTRNRTGRILSLAIPSLAVAGGLGALGFVRYYLQPRRLFLPDPYPEAEREPPRRGLPAEDVRFRAVDGTELHGWWIPHPDAAVTFLFCHGHSGNITHQLGFLRLLRRLHANVLIFDYRGYGRSGGEPSEKGLYLDARAAYDHLVGPLGRSPGEIILFGHSLGGAIAIDAALDRKVAGLVAQASFTDLRGAARGSFPGLHLAARNQFRSIEKVPRLTMPKLFIHGSSDLKIPLVHGERLFAAAAEPKQLYVVPGGGHQNVYLKGGTYYMLSLARFIEECRARSS